jgi:ATP-dependent DNA ligase
LPLVERKAKLTKLLARAPAGLIFNEHTDLDGATVFRHACKMGLGGHRVETAYGALPLRTIGGLA